MEALLTSVTPPTSAQLVAFINEAYDYLEQCVPYLTTYPESDLQVIINYVQVLINFFQKIEDNNTTFTSNLEPSDFDLAKQIKGQLKITKRILEIVTLVGTQFVGLVPAPTSQNG